MLSNLCQIQALKVVCKMRSLKNLSLKISHKFHNYLYATVFVKQGGRCSF